MGKTIEERRATGLYWDRAWALVGGCTKVSPGCDNCWSETEAKMRVNHPNRIISDRACEVVDFVGAMPTGFNGHVLVRHDNLDLPLRVKTPTVFSVWNDLWHEDVPLDFVTAAFQTMERARSLGHTFLVLTKRAERMANFLEEVGVESPDHIWWGVTCEDQQRADERIPHLLRVPGKRFLSVEPMIGPVDLNNLSGPGHCFYQCLKPIVSDNDSARGGVHAVLLGGESGPNARPMHPEWVRLVERQCAVAGVPFFFKQWGEWAPNCLCDKKTSCREMPRPNGPMGVMFRCGKKNAGRDLFGIIHDNLPWGSK